MLMPRSAPDSRRQRALPLLCTLLQIMRDTSPGHFHLELNRSKRPAVVSRCARGVFRVQGSRDGAGLEPGKVLIPRQLRVIIRGPLKVFLAGASKLQFFMVTTSKILFEMNIEILYAIPEKLIFFIILMKITSTVYERVTPIQGFFFGEEYIKP